ncbi:MAG: hypothetical protein ACI38A_04090, partial [Candidatus Ornithomonoglobus sp.]
IGYHVGAVLDVDNDTITLKGDIIDTTGVRTNTMNSGAAKSCTISDIAKVTIEFTGNASSNNFGVAVDNMQLYAMVNPSVAGALTINYVDGDGNSIADSTSVDVAGKSAGDVVSYSYPKYIVKDDTLYLADVTKYTDTTSLTESAKSVNVTYKSQGTGTYQYEDWDGTASEVASPSNGGYTTESTSFVVAEGGVYNIEGMAYSDGNANRYIELVVGGNVIYTSEGATRFGTAFSTTGVELRAGDVVNVNRRDSHGGYIDYILLTKTGEIPVRVTATNVGAFEDDATLGTTGVATAFKAEMGDVTGTLSFTVTPSEGEARTFEGATTLTEANVVLGIIVSGLYDAGATGVLTVVE